MFEIQQQMQSLDTQMHQLTQQFNYLNQSQQQQQFTKNQSINSGSASTSAADVDPRGDTSLKDRYGAAERDLQAASFTILNKTAVLDKLCRYQRQCRLGIQRCPWKHIKVEGKEDDDTLLQEIVQHYNGSTKDASPYSSSHSNTIALKLTEILDTMKSIRIYHANPDKFKAVKDLVKLQHQHALAAQQQFFTTIQQQQDKFMHEIKTTISDAFSQHEQKSCIKSNLASLPSTTPTLTTQELLDGFGKQTKGISTIMKHFHTDMAADLTKVLQNTTSKSLVDTSTSLTSITSELKSTLGPILDAKSHDLKAAIATARDVITNDIEKLNIDTLFSNLQYVHEDIVAYLQNEQSDDENSPQNLEEQLPVSSPLPPDSDQPLSTTTTTTATYSFQRNMAECNRRANEAMKQSYSNSNQIKSLTY